MGPTKSARRAAPYGSARDVPTYQELARQIQGGKLLTPFIARKSAVWLFRHRVSTSSPRGRGQADRIRLPD